MSHPTDGEPQRGSDVIVVRLGAGRYAVPLTGVEEVGRTPHITRVPGLPVWVRGVANWRGRILPVLDLRLLLTASPSRAPGPRLLVLWHQDMAAAVVVDAVEGTLELGPDVQPFPPTLSPQAATLVCGQALLPDGPVAILDVAAVMQLRDTLPQGRRAG